MPLQCPNCETLLIAGTRRCPACAFELEPAPHAPTPRPAAHAAGAPHGEKRRGEKPRSPDIRVEVADADALRLPGDAIKVRATLTGDGERVNEARVALVRSVRYEENYINSDDEERQRWQEDDTKVCVEVLAWKGELPRNFSKTVDLEWAVPADAAPSCAGKIMRTRWLVRARINIPWGFDLVRDVELKVGALPPAEQTAPGECGRMAVPDDSGEVFGLADAGRTSFEGVGLRFLLPKLDYAEGETLEGVLLVRVEEDLDVQEVTARLVRFERVGGNTRAVEGEPARLAAGGRLRAGQPLAYNFRLPIDSQGCPTSANEYGAVEWYVTAALERSLFSKDYAALQKIGVRAAGRKAWAGRASAPHAAAAQHAPRPPGDYALQPDPATQGDADAARAHAPRVASEGRKGLAVAALVMSALALLRVTYLVVAVSPAHLLRPSLTSGVAALCGALMGRRALARARKVPHLFGGAGMARAAVVAGLAVTAHTLLTTLLGFVSGLLF